MPTLSRSRRQVASSRPPNFQARVRRAAGSKARQSQTLFFPVHEVPHLVSLHDLARRLARRLRRGLAGRAQPPVDRDVADAQELGDHALAGVARGVEQDRQGLHGLGLAALRRGGEVAAAGLAEVALVAPYRAVLDERRPGAPLAAHLDQPCPPDPAVEPSYQTVDLWVNVSSAFLLRHSRLFPRKKNWGARYRSWLETQSFEHPADQIVLQEGIESVRLAEERLARLDRAIGEFLPTWSLAPLVEALQALLGVDLVTAVTFVVEVGDIRRFESPRRLMGYLGLVPGERSTGETVRRGSSTKMGNARVRHLLVESAWTYRHPPRVGKAKLPKLERVSPKVREIAWKAQSRLTARYRALTARGKKTTVTCTAIARELAAFMWAVAREARPA